MTNMANGRRVWLTVVMLATCGVPQARAGAAASKSALLEEMQASLILTAERIKPSVVLISTLSRPRRPGIPDNPFLPQPPQRREARPLPSSGSGLIIRSDGYILTNYHVVRSAETVHVTLDIDADSPERFPARVIGGDAEADLAVIKINKTGLKAATLGDSDKAKVGAWAIAVGSPLGETGSVTLGIISAKGRHPAPDNTEVSLYEYIQTDAAINPGNSGGPLCDLDGNVLGINSVIQTRTGFNMGIAYAVAANVVKEVLPHLIKGETVPRGFLGVSYSPLALEVAQGLGIEHGLVLGDFARGESPARAAGLQPGDIIVEVNGKRVTTSDNFRREIVRLGPGASVRVKALRVTDGNMRATEANVVLGQRPAKEDAETPPPPEPAAKPEPTSYGLIVDDPTPENLRKLGLNQPPKAGVLVMDVEQFSPASEARLGRGVVLLKVKVNREPWREVKSAEEFRSLVGKPMPGDRILLMARFPSSSGESIDYRALVAPSPAQ